MQSFKCPECGFVGWADAEFCKKCGAPVPVPSAIDMSAGAPAADPVHNASDSSDANDIQTHYYPPHVNPFPEDAKTRWAVAALVLGILNFLFLGLTLVSIVVGIIISVMALKKIKRFPFEHGGKGMAVTGLVLNIVSVVSLIPVLIVLAIAIPNLYASLRAANEGSAIGSLRQIHSAEATYQSTRGQGKYGTIDELQRMNLITPELASGTRHGYRFIIDSSTSDFEGRPGFVAVAVPLNYPSTGRRSFLIDETGVIRGEDSHGLQASRSAPALRSDSDYSDTGPRSRRSSRYSDE